MKKIILLTLTFIVIGCAQKEKTKPKIIKVKVKKMTKRDLRNKCISEYLDQVKTPQDAKILCNFIVTGD